MKEKCIENIDLIIKGLENIKEKIKNGIRLTNEDWQECAFPMNEIMEDLGNHRYLED